MSTQHNLQLIQPIGNQPSTIEQYQRQTLSGYRFPIPDSRFQVLDLWFLVSDF
jgi:hypothetical protein